MKTLTTLFAGFVLSFTTFADSSSPAAQTAIVGPAGALVLREIRYDGKLSDDEARFVVDLDAEATGKGEASLKLFEGEVALLPAKWPNQLRIVREGNCYRLIAAHPGQFKLKLELVAKIQRAEPWNQISFAGPAAAIASVTAQAGGAGMDVQLLSGTSLESARTNGVSRIKGFLAADQTVALRWSRLGGITEVARTALLTVDTAVAAQITPTVVKYSTQCRYEIVQGSVSRLTLALPAAQALTRLVGEQIRDWQIKSEGDRQVLTVEFIKPIERNYTLTLYSEQTVQSTPTAAQLNPPQPLEVERESGTFTLSAEDTVVEISSLTGLRQVNATDGALAAYRFTGRPFALALKLRRIEPVITTDDRVRTRLEETRLLVSHSLALRIEKAGIYALELAPQTGLVVADVRGEGVEDWKVSEGKLRVNFSSRVLGQRDLTVQLEQALKSFPDQIGVAPLRVTGATKETAQIGAASAPGIRLKTAELTALREVPMRALQSRTGVAPVSNSQNNETGATPVLQPDELLAFTAEQPDWKLALASERLAARVVAEVFNLVTIGDGLVGGSATIRYGLVNQGVQEFKVQLPPHCKNVEFTGQNIRRKELAGEVWTIGLQEKAWGGYTLVVTYDYQFDPKGATLPIGGIHTLEVERETGSIAVTTAASLKLTAKPAGDPLRRVDEFELAAPDRALITRSVLLAYQYTGDQYDLAVAVQRHPEERVLEAVADRTQITSVLTEAGEMLTQASFMVKNNEKQFQKFQLPKGANLWGCYVNGQAAKPERDGDWVLVSLPRDANRDQAFAVDIVYAEKKASLTSRWSQSLQLAAPRTDVPNTYAEWQLYVPNSRRLSGFGGSMMVAQGTTYELLDAWQKFLAFYAQVIREAGAAILMIGALGLLVVALVIAAARRGMSGVLTLLGVVAILAVLSAMLLPALSKAKARAQRINSANNLKQIGLAMRQFALDNGDRFPVSYEEMINELNTDKVTYDPETGQRYTYLAAGLNSESITPDSIVAYSPIVNGQCNILLADGSVQGISAARFAEYSQRGLIQHFPPAQIAQRQPANAVMGAQFHQPNAPVQTIAAGAAGNLPVMAAAPPSAGGARAIRIEIPREGKSVLFTKVLNVRDEPLAIRATIMSLHRFQTVQMAWQVAAFLFGLTLWGWQWRWRRNSFVLTLALVMVLGSVGSLLIAWRALHDALIVGLPALLVALSAWLVWRRFARRRQAPPIEPAAVHSPLGGDMPPAVAAIALLFTLGLARASATEPAVLASQSASANVSILSANYSGSVNDRVAQVEARLQFSAANPIETIPLFGADVAVRQFTVKGGEAKLVRDGKNVAVRLGRRADAIVQIKMLVKLGGDVTKRHLTFGIPPALTTQLALTLDQPEADVEFPTAISFKCSTEKEKTRVAAVLGAGERVELLWTPRVKRAAEVAATVFCQNASLVTFGGGVVNVRAVLDYQVTQGELRQVRVRLPAGQRLLRVEGEAIRTWEIKGSAGDSPAPVGGSPTGTTESANKPASPSNPSVASVPSGGPPEGAGQPPVRPNEKGGQILVVDLLKGISPSWRLTIETETNLDPLPASVAVELPQALDVKRETGLVALRGGEELSLAVESAQELQRVDAEEFARAVATKSDGLISVFRFLKPDFGLRARVEIVRPQIEAVARNHVRVGADQVSITSMIDYTIKRAGVFALKAVLPDGYRLEQVTGTNVLQWAERSEGETRLLEVALKERTSGAYQLRLELAKSLKELPKSLAIAGVHPLDTVKLTGFVSVAAEPGVATKSEAFDGLTEIPATSLLEPVTVGSAGSVLAYKFISAEPKSAPEWKLSVTTERVEAWLRAEIVNTLTLGETLVSGRALVRYDIANAPVKALRLRVPAAFRNVEVSGPNIRRSDQSGEVWRVELQSKARGFYALTVTWEQPRAAGTNTVELAGVAADGVERETGLLAIVAKSPLQVAEVAAQDLKRVDPGDFPEWAGRPDGATALAYRYVRPGYKLRLDARRYEEAEVLRALVDRAQLTTVVADDGQMMTEMSLSVRNNGRQFLEVELPPGATVWSAFVAGQPVRPGRREGKLLLPIEPTGTDDAAMMVELTYVGTNTFPRARGHVGFISPKFDVPFKNARWELFLPPDYAYQDFSGTMAREVAATPPSLLNFSSFEYAQMEKASRESAKAGVKKDVSEAEKNLSGGNVRDAVANYKRAKFRGGGKGEDADVKQLEEKLSKVQASNLVSAQNDFVFRNNGLNHAANGQSPAVGGQPPLRYDNAAAEQQWAKLQAAQEVVAAKVQPLHVNLPLRGFRCAFAQVLQTEVNQPMTIQLQATNTKTGTGLGRIGMGLVGFLALWTLVAVVMPRKRE